jgi:hypothetical protein
MNYTLLTQRGVPATLIGKMVGGGRLRRSCFLPCHRERSEAIYSAYDFFTPAREKPRQQFGRPLPRVTRRDLFSGNSWN